MTALDNFATTVTAAFPVFVLFAAVCGLSYIAYTAITWWEARADARFWRGIADRAESGWGE